jgi:hypothetical protein
MAHDVAIQYQDALGNWVTSMNRSQRAARNRERDEERCPALSRESGQGHRAKRKADRPVMISRWANGAVEHFCGSDASGLPVQAEYPKLDYN